MSEFTKSALEGSLLSVVVYNDNVKSGMSLQGLREVLSDDLSRSEIEYFYNNFEIVHTTGYDNSGIDITEFADSGYQGMLVKRKGSDDDGSVANFGSSAG